MKVIITISLIIMLALCLEKAFHMDMDAYFLTMKLKEDIKKCWNALKNYNASRYSIQDTKFWNDIVSITKRYADRNFEVRTGFIYEKEVPTIVIRFVQDHVLSEDELAILSGLLHKKFGEYIANEGFKWDSFAEYSVGEDYTFIYLHYSELQCDEKPFCELKKFRIRQRKNTNGDILCDEQLEEELKNVN